MTTVVKKKHKKRTLKVSAGAVSFTYKNGCISAELDSAILKVCNVTL
jgi:hypothetical protein